MNLAHQDACQSKRRKNAAARRRTAPGDARARTLKPNDFFPNESFRWKREEPKCCGYRLGNRDVNASP